MLRRLRARLLLAWLLLGPALAALRTLASLRALPARLAVTSLLEPPLLLAVAVLVARRTPVAPSIAPLAPGLIAPVLAARRIPLLIARLLRARLLDRCDGGGGSGLRRSRRLE